MAWSMRKYTNGEDIKAKIKEYFDDCERKTAENLANKIKWLEIPTVSGLALALEITTETLRNYLKDENYKDVQWEVAKAYMHFRDKYEQGAMNTGNLAFLRILATIFPEIYTDKQVVEHTGTSMPSVSVQIEGQEEKSLTFDVGEEIATNDA